MIDLSFIKSFVAITKTGSFRIAAERSHITQPAVSQHVKVLERQMKTALFERHGKKVALTPAGKTFLPYAENILKQYEEAKMCVWEIQNEFKGTIHIATIYSIGLYELRSTINKFLRKYPKIDLHFEYHHNDAIYEMVMNRTIDFGLVAFPQEKAGIVSKVFTEDKLVLVQSPLHRTIKRKTLLPKDLAGAKFIGFSPTTPTGNIISQYFGTRGIRPNIIHEYDNIELVKSAVVLGLGCAILPRNTITREFKDKSLEIIHANGLPKKRPLGILYPKGKVFTKSMLIFHDMLMAKNYIKDEPALRV